MLVFLAYSIDLDTNAMSTPSGTDLGIRRRPKEGWIRVLVDRISVATSSIIVLVLRRRSCIFLLSVCRYFADVYGITLVNIGLDLVTHSVHNDPALRVDHKGCAIRNEISIDSGLLVTAKRDRLPLFHFMLQKDAGVSEL